MSETYKFWWDKKNNIARGFIREEVNEEDAKNMYDDFLKIIEKKKLQTDWLLDLSKLKKVSAKARKVLVEITKKAQVRKNAFIGASIYIKVLSEFVRFAAGRKDSRYFTKEKDALKWIKE
jgi:hypothetical protein